MIGPVFWIDISSGTLTGGSSSGGVAGFFRVGVAVAAAITTTSRNATPTPPRISGRVVFGAGRGGLGGLFGGAGGGARRFWVPTTPHCPRRPVGGQEQIEPIAREETRRPPA